MLLSIKISRNLAFYPGSDKPIMLFFLLINFKMPTVVGILTFMSRKNSMLSWVEPDYFFTNSAPGSNVGRDQTDLILTSKLLTQTYNVIFPILRTYGWIIMVIAYGVQIFLLNIAVFSASWHLRNNEVPAIPLFQCHIKYKTVFY